MRCDAARRRGTHPVRGLLELLRLADRARRRDRADAARSDGLVSAQMMYNLVRRDLEREHVGYARAVGLALIAYGPLHGGHLAAGWRSRDELPPDSRAASNPDVYLSDEERLFAVTDALVAHADQIGATPGQVALAWVLRNPAITTTLTAARSGRRAPRATRRVHARRRRRLLGVARPRDRAPAELPDATSTSGSRLEPPVNRSGRCHRLTSSGHGHNVAARRRKDEDDRGRHARHPGDGAGQGGVGRREDLRHDRRVRHPEVGDRRATGRRRRRRSSGTPSTPRPPAGAGSSRPQDFNPFAWPVPSARRRPSRRRGMPGLHRQGPA